MSCAVQLVLLFVLGVNICTVRSWAEFPLSRHLREKRNGISETMRDADLLGKPPTNCFLQKLPNLYFNYQYVFSYSLYSSAGPRVLNANKECDYVMIDVEGQHRSRLELNGHEITDKLVLVPNSCYSAIFNANQYDLRTRDSTCYVSLRIVTGSPIVTIAFLKGFRDEK